MTKNSSEEDTIQIVIIQKSKGQSRILWDETAPKNEVHFTIERDIRDRYQPRHYQPVGVDCYGWSLFVKTAFATPIPQ